MEHLPEIGLAFAAFTLGMFSPGPNILSIMGTSMAISRRAGVAQALGTATGSFVWATITATGLAALVSVYAFVLTFIKILVASIFSGWPSRHFAQRHPRPARPGHLPHRKDVFRSSLLAVWPFR